MIFNSTEEVSLCSDMSSDEIERNSFLINKLENQIFQLKKKGKSQNKKPFISQFLQFLFYFYLLFLYVQFIVLIIYFFMYLIIVS